MESLGLADKGLLKIKSIYSGVTANAPKLQQSPLLLNVAA